jgi:hypothetical protein
MDAAASLGQGSSTYGDEDTIGAADAAAGDSATAGTDAAGTDATGMEAAASLGHASSDAAIVGNATDAPGEVPGL